MSQLPTAKCTSCFERKTLRNFPRTTVTSNCKHAATSCRTCIAAFLEWQSLNGLVARLSCPQCPEPLTFEQIWRFATPETFQSGRTGDEYARFVTRRSPSQARIEAPVEEKYALRDEKLRQGNIDANNAISRNLMEARQAAEAGRLTAVEKEACERRLAEETAARGAERRRQEEEEEEARELLERRRQEEEMTRKLIRQVTKPCPNCGVPIEKNGGCDHMHCKRCDHHFDWWSASWQALGTNSHWYLEYGKGTRTEDFHLTLGHMLGN
ncbi:hypothetical protein O1611_g5117 [Lasiodiplodia mahajangana]|uniref:Uncharacterized protein n=1 Tax=Lasiodiplodia mahajangana TaxID=1108764 RepID=A0ACC2JM80_9PEZI|nr:hypothetical protein O1611_g5117 [Lasiodiplodia mahajangana]